MQATLKLSHSPGLHPTIRCNILLLRLVTASQELKSGLEGPVRYFVSVEKYNSVHGQAATDAGYTPESRMVGTATISGVTWI